MSKSLVGYLLVLVTAIVAVGLGWLLGMGLVHAARMGVKGPMAGVAWLVALTALAAIVLGAYWTWRGTHSL